VRLIAAGMSLNRSAPTADPSACLAAARAALGEEAFARAYAEGEAMTLDQAAEYALAEGGDG
jgi:hypothetical protein